MYSPSNRNKDASLDTRREHLSLTGGSTTPGFPLSLHNQVSLSRHRHPAQFQNTANISFDLSARRKHPRVILWRRNRKTDAFCGSGFAVVARSTCSFSLRCFPFFFFLSFSFFLLFPFLSIQSLSCFAACRALSPRWRLPSLLISSFSRQRSLIEARLPLASTCLKRKTRRVGRRAVGNEENSYRDEFLGRFAPRKLDFPQRCYHHLHLLSLSSAIFRSFRRFSSVIRDLSLVWNKWIQPESRQNFCKTVPITRLQVFIEFYVPKRIMIYCDEKFRKY